MGLFSKIFGRKKTKQSFVESESKKWPEEYRRVKDFNDKLESLLRLDRFIARSDYNPIVEEYKELPGFFGTLEKSGMLDAYIE